ncbi:MAG: lipid II:glycine glycyltransferase FemX, partial [Nocardioidaceae bacterium]
MSEIVVRPISAAEHLAFLAAQPSVSFLQTPAWGEVKSEWERESLGWYDGAELVGAGLVLYRQLPKIKRYLAYLPEGPVLDWTSPSLAQQLTAMSEHLRRTGAFAVRMGPSVVARTWSADTLKAAIADETVTRLADVSPDSIDDRGVHLEQVLRREGWRQLTSGAGFAAGQPQHVFQLELRGRTQDDVLAGMNQQWRRNIKKAARSGVVVTPGSLEDWLAFHTLYVETAQRDSFTPRPLPYFAHMFQAMLAEAPGRLRLSLASHAGGLVTATAWVEVG